MNGSNTNRAEDAPVKGETEGVAEGYGRTLSGDALEALARLYGTIRRPGEDDQQLIGRMEVIWMTSPIGLGA